MRVPIIQLSKFDEKNLNVLNQGLIFLTSALNKGIEFGNETAGAENIYCDIVTVQFTAASAEVTAAHDLDRVPLGALLVKKDRIGDFYFSSPATSANLFLTTNTASLSAVLIII